MNVILLNSIRRKATRDSLSVLLLGCLLASCVSAQVGVVGPRIVGATFAEGYTGPALDRLIELAFRTFTLYSMPCEGLPATERVRAEPESISLKVGGRYSLSAFNLQAFARRGTYTPRVPIWSANVQYEEGIAQLESDNDRVFSLIGLREGKGLVQFQVGCGGEYERGLRVEIPVIVAE